MSSKTESLVDWGDEFKLKRYGWNEIRRYGWNPMLGTNICFIDEIEAKNKVSLCIEPSRFSSCRCRSLANESASGFFLQKMKKRVK
jgi:hypothetical protein